MVQHPIENYNILIHSLLDGSEELPYVNGNDLFVCDHRIALLEKDCIFTDMIASNPLESEEDKKKLESLKHFFEYFEDTCNQNCRDLFVRCEDIRDIYKQMREMETDKKWLSECPECKGTGFVKYQYVSTKKKIYYLDEICPICEQSGKIIQPENTVFVRLMGWYFPSNVIRQLKEVVDFYCPEEPADRDVEEQDKIELVRIPNSFSMNREDIANAFVFVINENVQFIMIASSEIDFIDDSQEPFIQVKDCRIIDLNCIGNYEK